MAHLGLVVGIPQGIIPKAAKRVNGKARNAGLVPPTEKRKILTGFSWAG